MSADLDMTDFNNALNAYMAVTPHALEEVINKKMLFIARGAMERTPRADRSAIEGALGVVGYKVSLSKKTGTFKRRKAIVGGSLVYRIINAAQARRHEKGLYGRAMQRAVTKFLGARLRAIGSLKAGWIHPIRIFTAIVKTAFGSAENLPTVKGRGTGKPATAGWNPVAEMTYEITERKGGSAGDQIDPRVEAALQAAFDAEAASMREYVEEGLYTIAKQTIEGGVWK